MKFLSSMILSAVMVAALCSAAQAEKGSIGGQLLDEKGLPLRGAEVRIQSYDQTVGGFGVKTDSDGNFSVKVPAGAYKFTLRVGGDDIFIANHITVHSNDPWQIVYNMKHALVTMSTAHSKKVRRFAYQSQRTGSQVGGRWVETTAPDGYEPDADHVETKSATSMLREMAKGHPGVVPSGSGGPTIIGR